MEPLHVIALAKDITGLLNQPDAAERKNTTELSESVQEISSLQLFDQLIPSGPIAKASRQLFSDGHYRQSVVDAYICLDQIVKKKANSTETGCSLMRTVFSLKKPILRLNALSTSSEENEQQGYMDMLAGAMMGIRNPRAHDHDWQDDAETALVYLHFAHHLAQRVFTSKRDSA